MARNASLGTIRNDVRAQSDGIGNKLRHTDQALDRLINQGIQRFREKISIEGAAHYLVSTTVALAAGATSPYSFASLSLANVSPGVVRVTGVDITVNGDVFSLLHVPFNARNDYGGPQAKSQPQAWAQYGTRTLAILPAPDAAYSIVVWYLPILTDLVNDNDTFDGVAGWEDFIVWDVVRRLTVRDRYPEAFGLATAYAAELWADIVRMATRVNSAGGSVVGRDTFGQRMQGHYRARMLPDP
jgi:hypothetical protein